MTQSAESALKSAFALHRAGQLAQAARLYGEIIRAEPANAEALYLLGFLHFQSGEFGEAERLLGASLAINPNAPDALYNRAQALMKLKRGGEALLLFDRLLATNPGIAEAWHGRGMALSALARDEEAILSYGRALAIRPLPETLNNRANVLFGLKRFEESAADYEAILATGRDIPYARGSMVFSRLHGCDWRGLAEQKERIAAELRAGGRVAQPGAMLAISDSPEDQRRAAEIWAASEVPPARHPLWAGERYSHERIRLAYISADFCSHAVAYLIAGVMEAHDRNRFEVTAISLGSDDGSDIRQRIANACEHFIDASGRDDAEIAGLVRSRETGIAIDLMGYTGGSRMGIFASRPAPVQASFLGFPGTTGAPYIDYLIADPIVVPKDDRRHFRETIAYLPDTYLPSEFARTIAKTPSRREAGLPETGFVFCSFNNTYKLTPELFGLWMRLLRTVEGSVLWLGEGNSASARNLKREAEDHGIDPRRLVLAPFLQAREDHLARLRLAGVFLDTLPYGGHASALDALWAGVPVLTCLGKTFAGRVAASLVSAAGIPELAASSLAEYERIALELATGEQKLSQLKTKLAANREAAALFDTLRFTRNLEAAYTRIWETSCP